MAQAVCPRPHSIYFIISSRQDQGGNTNKTFGPLQPDLFLQIYNLSKFIFPSSSSSSQTADPYSKHVTVEAQDFLNKSKKRQIDSSLKLACKNKTKIVKPTYLTIFLEDLSSEHGKPGKKATAITQHEYNSENSINAYFLAAQFRKGVRCLNFWQYLNVSKASVTVVGSDGEDNQSPATSVIYRVPIFKKKKYFKKYYLHLKTGDIDLSTISLSELEKHSGKVPSHVLHDLREITRLPRNKSQLQLVKVPRNSVTVVAYPGGRKKTPRNGRRGQQQRSQNAESESHPQREIPIQTTERDGIDRRPGPDTMVTSMEPIFSKTGIPPATTNLMSSIESEERLATRRQGTANMRINTPTLRPPRYPDFTDQEKRRTSFTTNWPESNMQDPTHMANHGFFFTGRQDLVRCFQCGIGMKDWSEADEPLFEHIRHSPECSFLLELLGPELLAAYKVNLIPAGAQPATGESTGSRSTQNPSMRTSRGTAQRTTSTTTGVSDSTTTPMTTSTASSNIRSPQYSTLDSRLQSFSTGWPSDHAQTPTQLSEAGFFFTGYGDVCRCFTCDGGLQRWDPMDDPWIEHARWFPTCDFVIQARGQEYVDLVQRAAAQDSEDEDPAVVMQPNIESVSGAVGNINLDSVALSSEAAKKAQEMGFSRKAIMLAIHELNVKGETELKPHSIVDVLNAKKERGEALPTDTPPNEAEDIDPEKANDPEYLQKENERLRSILKCVKCEERDANILFIPCTHHKMCEECAEDTLLCPACGRDIDKKVKTYMS